MSVLRLATMTDMPESTYPKVVITPATAAHVRELGRNIRDGDRREIENYGFSCNKGLWLTYRKCLSPKVALIDGKVAALWGAAGTYMGDVGQPCLLTSNEVEKISPLKFARIYQKEVHKMLEMFPSLVNYVDASYDKAVRLLSIVGFEIGEPEEMGKGYYRKFQMDRIN